MDGKNILGLADRLFGYTPSPSSSSSDALSRLNPLSASKSGPSVAQGWSIPPSASVTGPRVAQSRSLPLSATSKTGSSDAEVRSLPSSASSTTPHVALSRSFPLTASSPKPKSHEKSFDSSESTPVFTDAFSALGGSNSAPSSSHKGKILIAPSFSARVDPFSIKSETSSSSSLLPSPSGHLPDGSFRKGEVDKNTKQAKTCWLWFVKTFPDHVLALCKRERISLEEYEQLFVHHCASRGERVSSGARCAVSALLEWQFKNMNLDLRSALPFSAAHVQWFILSTKACTREKKSVAPQRSATI